MPNNTIEFKVSVEKKEFEEICQQQLKTIPGCILSTSSDGFVLKETKMDLLNGTYAATAYIKFEQGVVTILSKCAGFGPFQKNHVTEFGEIVKNVIERGITEKQTGVVVQDDVIRCPKCGSTQIQLQKRGWSLGTGLIGSGRNERVCLQCLYKF